MQKKNASKKKNIKKKFFRRKFQEFAIFIIFPMSISAAENKQNEQKKEHKKIFIRLEKDVKKNDFFNFLYNNIIKLTLVK